MAWLAVDKNSDECVHSKKPKREYTLNWWECTELNAQCVLLPSGSIEKLIGRKLTWEDEPVEI